MWSFSNAHEEHAMKRFHVHLGVPDLAASIRFYTGLFGVAPSVEKHDYAKWMLEDPRVNFAISHRGGAPGLNHLGMQAESADELAGIRTQFETADAGTTVAEPGSRCCYVKSDKHWVTDPQGVAWEAFHTLETIPLFGGEPDVMPAALADSQPSAQVTTQPATPSVTSGCCAPGIVAETRSQERAKASGRCCN
jgi:catechol 2,3-dioxygenase-like lactoylglutathione lyase family enzyme